ncbi:hypothetical protein ABXT70_09825 [Candidatus Njordibacter sp. Uisw_039]|uniref:hypothetical protein n=1 Tax=Candidatus Njordibacter sp. Uisw_039 TaxID=3230972 RepID=UPI003D596D41
MKYSAVDSVRVFVSAVANELQQDEHVFAQFPVSRFTNLVIPRLEKLAFWAENFPRLLSVIANIAYIFWVPLYLLFLLLQTIGATFYISGKSALEEKEIFFANSLVSIISSKSTHYCGKFLYSTKALEKAGPAGESLGCIRDYASLSDIRSAFLNSVRSLFIIWKDNRKRGVIFQVYPAFQWFLTWNVLQKSKVGLKTIWISSDRDRWAVLFDQLPINAERIIVQHGLLNDPAGQAGFRNPESLPTLLNNIYKIILLDKNSESWYRDRVLAKESHTQFVCSKGLLPQQGSLPNAMPSSLIVGQRECLKKECRLANYLVAAVPKVRIYLKPHPSVSTRQYEKFLDKRIRLIKDPFFFPIVSLCICNDYSTLAYLYAKNGTKVIYINEIEEETPDYLQQLLLDTLAAQAATSSAIVVPNSSTNYSSL